MLILRHNSKLLLSKFNPESIVRPNNFSLYLAVRGISSIQTISGFLMLREMWDFPGSAFKWLFSKQHESLDADACNSKAAVGLELCYYLLIVFC